MIHLRSAPIQFYTLGITISTYEPGAINEENPLI